MPNKVWKANIYAVTSEHAEGGSPIELSEAIGRALNCPLLEREKDIGGKRRRLDYASQENGLYLLNFVSFEFSGTGKVRQGQVVQSVALQPDESFAPETAMLYDPENSLAFIESAIGSMGPHAIVDYFQEFADPRDKYFLEPMADPDARARARRHQTIRKLEMRVNAGTVTEIDREAGVGPLRALGNEFGGESINIEIAAGRTKASSLNLDAIERLFTSIFGQGTSRDMPHITKLRVNGREYDDDPVELIDLIQHRQWRQASLSIDPDTRKIPHRLRWDTLVNLHGAFTQATV